MNKCGSVNFHPLIERNTYIYGKAKVLLFIVRLNILTSNTNFEQSSIQPIQMVNVFIHRRILWLIDCLSLIWILVFQSILTQNVISCCCWSTLYGWARTFDKSKAEGIRNNFPGSGARCGPVLMLKFSKWLVGANKCVCRKSNILESFFGLFKSRIRM